MLFLEQLLRMIDPEEVGVRDRLEQAIANLKRLEATHARSDQADWAEKLKQEDEPSILELGKRDLPITGKNMGDFEGLISDPKVANVLAKLEQPDFNVFDLKRATHGNELYVLINYLLQRHDLLRGRSAAVGGSSKSIQIDREKFRAYSFLIQSKYNHVAYHNKTHAADVTQVAASLIYPFADLVLPHDSVQAEREGKALRVELCCDADRAVHPRHGALVSSRFNLWGSGLNNAFMVETSHQLAVRYNDKSVLENYHIATSFAAMSDPAYDIFEGFSKEQYKSMRESLVNVVLATDNAKHFDMLASFNSKLENGKRGWGMVSQVSQGRLIFLRRATRR